MFPPKPSSLGGLASSVKKQFPISLSYQVSEDYPEPISKWLNWLLLVLAPTCLALITVFNIVTTGYELVPVYTTNPNGTEQQHFWFNSPVFTWGGDLLKPQCQNLDIPLGSRISTSNNALRYTLVNVSQPVGDRSVPQPSLSYHNAVLSDCEVDSIVMTMRKTGESSPGGIAWWSWTDSSAQATVHCNVTANSVPSTMWLQVDYPSAAGYSAQRIDAKSNASAWWGISVLYTYWAGVESTMEGTRYIRDGNEDGFIPYATLSYFPGNTTSMTDNHLFAPTYVFRDKNGNLNVSDPKMDVNVLYQNPSVNSVNFSEPVTEGFYFAKVFRSLLLSDLGKDQAPNLLHDQSLLKETLLGQGDFNRQPGGFLNKFSTYESFNTIHSPNTSSPLARVLMNESYGEFGGFPGNLATQPATISGQYICSTPRRKPIPAIVLSTLIADLVLTRAAWSLFKLVADYYVQRHSSRDIVDAGTRSHDLALRPMDPLTSASEGSLLHSAR